MAGIVFDNYCGMMPMPVAQFDHKASESIYDRLSKMSVEQDLSVPTQRDGFTTLTFKFTQGAPSDLSRDLFFPVPDPAAGRGQFYLLADRALTNPPNPPNPAEPGDVWTPPITVVLTEDPGWIPALAEQNPAKGRWAILAPWCSTAQQEAGPADPCEGGKVRRGGICVDPNLVKETSGSSGTTTKKSSMLGWVAAGLAVLGIGYVATRD